MLSKFPHIPFQSNEYSFATYLNMASVMERIRGINVWMLSAFVLLCPSYVRCQYEGDVRLVDGSTSYEGRVEIYHSGQWGTVCDDSWDNTDASVVCRQLGYSSVGAVARSEAYYGQGSGPIHLDDVLCTGYETRLTYCGSNGWGVEDCWHFEDAGVSCVYENSEGDVRLVDGFSSDDGRVEIYHNGQWGTICDNSWDNSDARVVCRQLGYTGNVGVAKSGGTYGQGSGPIYLDGVYCSGYESRLTYCSNGGWENNYCFHFQDAGVDCRDDMEGDVRLVDGFRSDEGRVEIYHDGQWGTICDDGWDDSDARVVCRQLGYSGDVGEARIRAHYGEGSGPIHLDDVSCWGYEYSLTSCGNSGWGIENCNHDEDAGVDCGHVTTTVTTTVTTRVLPFKPTVSSKVVGTMSFVGVSLSLLTLVAIIAVCYTCNPSKPAIRTSPTDQLPLSTGPGHPAAINTPAAPTTNGITYPLDPTQPSMPPPSQLPANAYPPAADSNPPSAPPAYESTVEFSNPLASPN